MLQRMVQHYYTKPHRFICVTDDPTGLDASVEVVPLWRDYIDVPSPHGMGQPACYVRLKAFAPEMRAVLGERFVSIDLDVMVTADLSPLWDRTEDFLIWHHRHPSPGTNGPNTYYNGSMWMLTAGSHPEVWERFTGESSAKEAYSAGHHGSDQGWMSYTLPKAPGWQERDGVYAYSYGIRGARELPKGTRLVSFHGPLKPWDAEAQKVPWVRANYPMWVLGG
jgi:hypothetical protein